MVQRTVKVVRDRRVKKGLEDVLKKLDNLPHLSFIGESFFLKIPIRNGQSK